MGHLLSVVYTTLWMPAAAVKARWKRVVKLQVRNPVAKHLVISARLCCTKDPKVDPPGTTVLSTRKIYQVPVLVISPTN